jgi:N-methylhydantoinase A
MRRLGKRLGLDAMETAQGVVSVVVANMAKAIRVISVERGYDPRDYVLFGFGGAGPIHAARLARALEMPRVVIPKFPGIMCALGLLLTDLRTNFSATRLQPLVGDRAKEIEAGFAELYGRANAWFASESIAHSDQHLVRSVDLRYGGQSFELNVECPLGAFDATKIAALRVSFEQAHRQICGYISENEPIHLTTLRLEAVGRVPKARLARYSVATSHERDALTARRQVWLPEAGGFVDCPLYDRDRLGPGHVLHGPAIVEQMDSTTLVLPGQTATVDPYLNLIIEG